MLAVELMPILFQFSTFSNKIPSIKTWHMNYPGLKNTLCTQNRGIMPLNGYGHIAKSHKPAVFLLAPGQFFSEFYFVMVPILLIPRVRSQITFTIYNTTVTDRKLPSSSYYFVRILSVIERNIAEGKIIPQGSGLPGTHSSHLPWSNFFLQFHGFFRKMDKIIGLCPQLLS